MVHSSRVEVGHFSRALKDLGLVTAVGTGDTFVFPIVNVVWTF